MKRYFLRTIFSLLLFFIAGSLFAQNDVGDYRRMFRVYEDNDALKLFGKISDRAYSNGTRLDYFYYRDKTPRSVIYKLMPKAGDSSVNTHGWGLMQIMITPADLRKSIPVANDYRYAGALFLMHTLHSTNELKKINLQSEWILGVMGPPAMAKEIQLFLHNLIRFVRPAGWDTQLPTDLLLNYNLTVEKAVVADNKSIDLIGGGMVYLGTMLNGGSLYTLVRLGKMNPYFKSYMGQFAHGKKAKQRTRYYFTVRPGVDLIVYNALIRGGIFHKKNTGNDQAESINSQASIRKLVGHMDIGAVVSFGKAGVSITHKTATPMIRGLPNHSIGNISFYLAF